MAKKKERIPDIQRGSSSSNSFVKAAVHKPFLTRAVCLIS